MTINKRIKFDLQLFGDSASARELRSLKAQLESMTTEVRSLNDADKLEEAKAKMTELRSLKEKIAIKEELLEEERSKVPTDPENRSKSSKADIEVRAIRKLLLREELSEEERASIHITNAGAVLPESFQTKIETLRKGYKSLKSYCRVLTVGTNTGRVPLSKGLDTSKLANLQKDTEMVKEMLNVEPVSFATSDYGKIVPIDNSVLEDTTTDLMTVIDEEFAENAVNTENDEIIKIVKLLADVADGADYKAIEKAINTLSPSARSRAIIITNTNGWAFLDELKDLEGRPLLKQLSEGGEYRFKGLEVVEIDPELLPDGTKVDGTTEAYEFFIVDLKKLVAFFDRKGYEIGTSKEAGFTLNQTLVRVLERFDVQSLVDKTDAVTAKFAKRIAIAKP